MGGNGSRIAMVHEKGPYGRIICMEQGLPEADHVDGSRCSPDKVLTEQPLPVQPKCGGTAAKSPPTGEAPCAYQGRKTG